MSLYRYKIFFAKTIDCVTCLNLAQNQENKGGHEDEKVKYNRANVYKTQGNDADLSSRGSNDTDGDPGTDGGNHRKLHSSAIKAIQQDVDPH